MLRADRISALSHWLTAGAPGPASFAEVVAEIGQRLVAAGMPLAQLVIYKTLMHPELPARLDYWSPRVGSRFTFQSPETLASGEQWIGTPAQISSATGRAVIYTLGEAPEFDDREDMLKLRARGYTQIANLPLHSRYTLGVPVVAFGTKQAGGFAPEELDALRRLQAPIARVTEGFVLHGNTVAILSTYVGRDAGDRVLTGNIRRGETETIPAIVLFVDLKDFTTLSNRLAPAEVVGVLNHFFSVLDDAIKAQGGEILKFIGDGALAIFPTPDDFAAQAAAAAGALAVLEDVRTMLESGGDETGQDRSAFRFRAALHLGDVHYGNIGSTRRLDFTVIGPTVNLAARLLQAAAEVGEDVVCSGEFAALLDTPPRALGDRALKGFDGQVPLFALDIDGAAGSTNAPTSGAAGGC